jgi:hypothetical protein
MRTLLLLLALSCCTAAEPPSPLRPIDGATIATAPVVSSVPPPAATPSPLPPLDGHCAKDSDCATTQLTLTGAYACCLGCGTSTAGATSWVSEVNAACERYVAQQHAHCPPLACPSGPRDAECSGGACVIKWPAGTYGPRTSTDPRLQ